MLLPPYNIDLNCEDMIDKLIIRPHTNPVLPEQDELPLGEFYPWKLFCHKSAHYHRVHKTIRPDTNFFEVVSK